MEKLKLNKIEREEVKALEKAQENLEKAQENLEKAQEALDNAKKSTAKNRASVIGNAYIAYTEAIENLNEAEVKMNEAEEVAKNATINFPRSDSKEEWVKQGLSNEYNAISLWFKASDTILEACKASILVNNKMNKQDILNYIEAYRHQVTNCNDLIRLGFLSENSSLVVKNKANFAFINKEARQSSEACRAKAQAEGVFTEVLEFLINSFIE